MGDSLSLLGTLYGFGGTSSGSAYGALTALTQAERNQSQSIAAESKQPAVARTIAQFTAAVQSAKSPAALLANPTVMKVLLTANGLGDQADYTALAQKALLSDTTKPSSLANKLSDTRWKSVASTYDFANKGLSVIQNPKTISTLGSAYAEVLWRQSLDAANPGLSNALSFRASASSIGSVDQILGDPTLRTVVTTSLGIPAQIAFQDLPAQEKAISDRVDITRFKDPKFVESFTQQYLIQMAASNGSSGTASLDQLAVSSLQA